MPAIQPGVGSGQAEAIARGFHEALNRLKGGDCARFFGCNPKDPNNAAARELATIQWGIFADQQHPWIIAHTYTNADRAEFNTASSVFDNSDPTWRSPNPIGFRPRYNFGDTQTLLAFFMLHELAHHFPDETNFQPDAGLRMSTSTIH
jgi:hypothetical protein